MRNSRPAAQPSGAITTPSASSSSADAPRRPPSRRVAAAAFPTHFFGDEAPRAPPGNGAATSNDAANGAPGPAASRPSRVSRMKTRADSKVANNKKRKGSANSKDDAPTVASKVARLQTTTAAPPPAAAAPAARRAISVAGPSTRADAAKDRSHLARQPQRQQSRRPEAEAEAPAAAGQGSSNHTSAHGRSDPISTGSDEPSWSRRKPTPPQYRAKAATEVELVPALTSVTEIDAVPPQEPVQQQQSELPQQPVQEQQQPEPVTRAAPPPPPQTTVTATRRVLAPETPADQRRGTEQQQQRHQRYVPGQDTPTRPRAESDDRLAISTRRTTTTTSRRLGIGFGQPMNTTKSFGHGGATNRRLAALGARPVVSQTVDTTSSQEPGATTLLEPDETGDAHPGADEAVETGEGVFQISASLPPPRPPPLPLASHDPAPPDKETGAQEKPLGAASPNAAEASVARPSAAAAAPSSSLPSSALDGRYVVKVERWVMVSDEENDEAQQRDATSSAASPASNHDDAAAAAAAAASQIDRVLSAADDEYRRQVSPGTEDSRRPGEISTTGVAAQGRAPIGQGKLVPVQAKIWRRARDSRGKHASTAADAANTYRLKGAEPPKRSAVVRWARRWGIGEDDG